MVRKNLINGMRRGWSTNLFLFHRIIVEFHVTREVVLQNSQKNNCQESRQEQDQNEGIDDRQPMNLEGARQKSGLRIAGHAILPHQVWFIVPLHRVGKLNCFRRSYISNVDPSIHLRRRGKSSETFDPRRSTNTT